MLQAEMLSRVGPPGIDVPVKNTPADGNSCDPRDTNQHAMCQQWCGSLPGGLEQQAIHCDRTILKHAIGTAEDQGPDTGLPHSAGPEADAQVPDNTARDTSSAEDSNSQDTICEAHARKALRSLARMVMYVAASVAASVPFPKALSQCKLLRVIAVCGAGAATAKH